MMKFGSRERIKQIFNCESADRCGFWLGNPHDDTLPILKDYFKVDNEEELRLQLGDDMRWISAEWDSYDGTSDNFFDWRKEEGRHGAPGVFASCDNVKEVENFNWPDPDNLDFSKTIERLEEIENFYRLSGMWAPFYHQASGAFGMENFFRKMHTHPEVVDKVIERICRFYINANEKFFDKAGHLVDGFFFGNDFGTQRDLMISPKCFERFITPWLEKFVEQGHDRDLQVVLHSCGAIHRVIGTLIDIGVDALHPLQAKAKNMEAKTLSEDFAGKIAFVGGIDTQDLLVNAAPEEVEKEVKRIKGLLGPSLVVSPSHEALLPNVPPENVLVISKAAHKIED